MSTNQDTTNGIGDANNANANAGGIAGNAQAANAGDAHLAAGEQAAFAVARGRAPDDRRGSARDRRRRRRSCGLTARQYDAMDDAAIIRGMSRHQENPQYRVDAATLDPMTLSNEQIAATWNITLLNTYIRNLDFPLCPRQMHRLMRRYWVIHRQLRYQRARVHSFWALLLVDPEFQAAVRDLQQYI